MARRERETMDYLAMVSRMIRAAGRRVGDADEPELARLYAMRAELDDAIAAAIHGQRTGPAERSWAHIGRALGVSRQTAQERWGAARPAAATAPASR